MADSITTLPAHLAADALLQREAHALMPFKVDACSYPLGPLRQAISSCRTCGTDDVPVGVCYACAVSCHAQHDLVELFARRNFTCDCPASSATPCTLLPAQPRARSNTYTRNFRGEFCRCERGKRYDPMEESESMIECVACQDWFHESCLNLQDPSNPTRASDTASQSTTSSIESPILPSTSYAHLLCAHCITRHPLLRRYAGTPGWCMIVPRPGTTDDAAGEWEDRWDVIGRRHPVGHKRARSHSSAADASSPPAKRVRGSPSAEITPTVTAAAAAAVANELTTSAAANESTTSAAANGSTAAAESTTSCTLPLPNAHAQRILDALDPSSDSDAHGAKGDVFLLPSARETICTCSACIAHVEQLPFPLEDEPEYEPAEDSPEPTEESLASSALQGLPRAQTIEALLAFNAMKDKLKAFLEPFRDGGRVVSAEDIGEFMQSVKQGGK